MEIWIISILRDIHVLNNNSQLVKKCCTCAMLSRSVMSDSLWPHGLYNPWNSAGQNPGVGCHALLQGIFLTQGSNSGLPPSRQILYPLSHQESPGKWLCIGERNAGELHARLWWVRSKKRAHEWVPAAVGQGVGERRREGDRKRGRAERLCWWPGPARDCRLSAGNGCFCRDPVVRVFDDWTEELGIFLLTVESSKESFFRILEGLFSNYYFLLLSLRFSPRQKFVIWRNIFKKKPVWSYMKKKWVRRETRCIMTEWQTRDTPKEVWPPVRVVRIDTDLSVSKDK